MKIELDNPLVKQWTKGEKIITSKWSPVKENLQVITLYSPNNQCDMYKLYRFFYVGNRVQVSCDTGACSIDKMLDYLLHQNE
jgi:hypothetical protein